MALKQSFDTCETVWNRLSVARKQAIRSPFLATEVVDASAYANEVNGALFAWNRGTNSAKEHTLLKV